MYLPTANSFISVLALSCMLSLVAAFASVQSNFRSTRPFSHQPLFLESLQEQEDRYLELAISNTGANPDIVYILMYNPGTEQEGVHTAEYPKDGSGAEVVLGFEDLGNCIQFSAALKENSNFPLDPIPTPVPLEHMKASAETLGLNVIVVPLLT